MESFIIRSLPPIFDHLTSQPTKKLPEFKPIFFVPLLEDRPQNPIVEALVDSSTSSLPRLQLTEHEDEDNISATCSSDAEEVVQRAIVVEDTTDIWTAKEVIAETRAPKNQNLSWDALRATFPKGPTSTPFLSEQPNDVFDAARHHVQPRLNDPSLPLRYVLPTELMDHLLINLVGNSSSLYVWNSHGERLVPYGEDGDAKLLVIIEGLDDVASTSVIQRFLSIGTLMRRLELLVTSLQHRHSSPTTHAFSHALSTILVYIRTFLSKKPTHPATHTTGLWLHYADTESVLSALASLCHRNNSPPYDPLPKSPANLLSHVYRCLEQHIEHRSSRTITALLAYILTITSRDYFATLGESLGLLEPSRPPWLRAGPQYKSRDHRRGDDILPLDDVEPNNAIVSTTNDDAKQSDMPTFVPTELSEALPAARKSLRILQAADPDHHLCSSSVVETCRWVWTSEEAEMLWERREQQSRPEGVVVNVSDTDTPTDMSIDPSGPSRQYQPELAQFQLFDLEPGAHLDEATTPSHTFDSASFLIAFLASFPECLSPLTPKLQHLATVVLQPLFTRTAVLSSALLKLYLTSLQLETHLILLRSYMLFTLPSFRMRLVDALFSDTDEIRPMGRGVRAQTRARLGIQDSRDRVDETADPSTTTGHGIGLGQGLAERDTWPPGGADLSFFLRTVIVDSLDERKNVNGDENVKSVWREGEFRLGFALRDLPVGDGLERWLNPMSIEAFDFLYLDYRPPHPLDVVITPVILSKYQRIFTFLLRLFRTETVSRIIYRNTFKSTSPLFSYAPKAQKILLSLRIQIQGFVTAFTTYVFDSVIGGNFDAYLQRISELRSTVTADEFADRSEYEFTSVFALRDSHSELLDRILRGCLLRTPQRAASDALRELLETILQLGVLVTKLRGGTIREAAGAEELSELFTQFQTQMLFFVKTIQAMHVKDQAHDKTTLPGLLDHLDAEKLSYPSDQRSHMEDLLTRIDPTGWWRRKVEKQSKRPV